MDDKLAIKATGIGKRYRLGTVRQAYGTLRDSMSGLFKLTGGQQANRPAKKKTIWALKDISFEVPRGQVLGLIGSNGSGKTTLLKILSRITSPTEGQAEIRGRVGSLLEVGTGFHPELTGRENIFLSGSILGMRQRQIRRIFDEIVDFSGVETFIDTPVKRYSSGMYVRLAFAVAANLDPDILLVDEVLAVGDAAFQKKCLHNMSGVAQLGRTILYVSHNMASIQNLCDSVLVLDQGRITFSGEVDRGISNYLSGIYAGAISSLKDCPRSEGGEIFRFVDYHLLNDKGKKTASSRTGDDLHIKLYYEAEKELDDLNISIAIKTSQDVRLSSLSSQLLNRSFSRLPKTGAFTFQIRKLPLNAGQYFITLDTNQWGKSLDRIEHAIILDVESGDFWGSGKVPHKENPFLLDYDISFSEE